jgi:hypothetical protein
VLHRSARLRAAELPQSTAAMRKSEMTGSANCGTTHFKGASLPENETMLRKIMLACVAVAAIATVAIPTEVSARWGGGGFRGGGFHGGFHRGFGSPRFYGRGFGYYPYYGAAVGLGLYGAYNYGCYRPVRVATPWGPSWRRVWVCG